MDSILDQSFLLLFKLRFKKSFSHFKQIEKVSFQINLKLVIINLLNAFQFVFVSYQKLLSLYFAHKFVQIIFLLM